MHPQGVPHPIAGYKKSNALMQWAARDGRSESRIFGAFVMSSDLASSPTIDSLVAAAPPLSEAARARIALLLGAQR